MIKVKKLKPYESITELMPGQAYLAKKEGNMISLNKNIRVRLSENQQIDEENFPVKITKIVPPDIVEGKIVTGDYEIEDTGKSINQFTMQDIGKKETLYTKVTEITQTSGPTLFSLFDGTGTITAKSFAGPGARAFPEIEKSDAIKANVMLKEREGNIEAELLSYSKLVDKHKDCLLRKIDRKVTEAAKPASVEFLSQNPVLEKLKPYFMSVATEIKKAIVESRPIILRHHADCDGYTGAVALERAILPLIMEHHNDEKARWRYYKRAPCKAPFYEYTDATKDLAFAVEDMEKFGQKEPLILLVDNGSTDEDILGIRKVKIYNARVVVVDHHNPGQVTDGRVAVDNYVDAHVNPHLVGGNSYLTAGMLSVELARFLNNKVENIGFLAALAGFGDKVPLEEFSDYLKIAQNSGLSQDFMIKLAEVIDFEAHYIRFIESRGIVDDLLGNNLEKQQQLVGLLYEDIQKKRQQQLKTVIHYSNLENNGRFHIATVDIAKVTHRGDYPASGKSLGLLHDYLKQKHGEVITLGYGPDFITMRITENVSFDVNQVINSIKQSLPHAFADGGGHEHAGTVRFVEAAREEIIDFIKNYIKEI